MMILSVIFSVLSTGMMSYLAMTTELGSWIAPMFVVVCMALMMPFFDARWFKKHAVITIATSSVGGMVGTCLGLSFPSFYFLHKHLFLQWIAQPWMLLLIICSFVICAGAFAFMVAYLIKDIILARPTSRFPMVHLVHNVIFVETQKMAQVLMVIGIGFASMWNIFIAMTHAVVSVFLAQINAIPMLMSVGFVTGIVIAPAMLLGLFTRICIIDILQQNIVTTASTQMFLITFASGMLIAWFLVFLYKMCNFQKIKHVLSIRVLMQAVSWQAKYGYMVGIFAIAMLLLSLWGVSSLAQWYVMAVLILLSWYVGLIIAEVGAIEVDNYVWFILLPLIYFSSISSLAIIAIAVFTTLCLGLVVDAVFSYKLAQLANIQFSTVFRYQILACLIAAFSAAIFFFIYSKYFDLASLSVFFAKVRELDDIIQFGQFDYRVVVCGMAYGLLIRVVTTELLVVIGSVVMTPALSCWLIISGAIAHFVRNREQYYPLWFGVYAGHSLCLMIKAFL